MTTNFRETVTKFLHTAEALTCSEVGLFESGEAGKVRPLHPLHFFVWIKMLAPLEKELSQALFGPDLYKMDELLDELGCDWRYDEVDFWDDDFDGYDPRFRIYFNNRKVVVKISRYMYRNVNISFNVITKLDDMSGEPLLWDGVADWMLHREDKDTPTESIFTYYDSPLVDTFRFNVSTGGIEAHGKDKKPSFYTTINDSHTPIEIKVVYRWTHDESGVGKPVYDDSNVGAISSLISAFNAT